MGKYPIHRVDANTGQLLHAFARHGCQSRAIHQPLDFLIAIPTTRHGWVNAIVEFKDADTPMQQSQTEFIDFWPGLTAVVRTPDDVNALVKLVQES